jgi:hypothetical protein
LSPSGQEQAQKPRKTSGRHMGTFKRIAPSWRQKRSRGPKKNQPQRGPLLKKSRESRGFRRRNVD